MSAHGHHKHSHDLPQEIIVAKVFWTVVVFYFLLELFLAVDSLNLLSGRLFESGGPSLLWRAVSETWLVWIKPVFVTLNFLCIGVAIFAIIKVWPIRAKLVVFKNPHAHHGEGHGSAGGHGAAASHNPAVMKHWADIVKRANTGAPENIRWSIMEADALVDMVIKERGVAGETMADRLANFRREDYKTVDKVWDAHRLRNEIAHTPGFKVSTKHAEKALFAYRDFLKELKAF